MTDSAPMGTLKLRRRVLTNMMIPATSPSTIRSVSTGMRACTSA